VTPGACVVAASGAPSAASCAAYGAHATAALALATTVVYVLGDILSAARRQLGRAGHLRPRRGCLRSTPVRRCHTIHSGGQVGSKHQRNGRQQPNATPAHAPPRRSPRHKGCARKGGDRYGGRVCSSDWADPLTVSLDVDDEDDRSSRVDSPG
jgi:hypothetical protein